MRYIILILIALPAILSAQGNTKAYENTNVIIGGRRPETSSILELRSTNQGLLLPRMSTAQRDSIPATEGLHIYNTDSDALQYHNGAKWISLDTSATLATRSWVNGQEFLTAEVDGSTTNEIQTLSAVSNQIRLSSGGDTVTIAGAGINTVSTGTKTITITGTEVDGSTTNEIQTVDTLAISGRTLSVSLSSDAVPAKTLTIPYDTLTMIIACSDETTNLAADSTKAVVTFRMPYAATITKVKADVNTASTGSLIRVDINEAGTSILSTKLTIDADDKTSEDAATAAVISDSSVANNAEMTINIDAVGSSTPGKGLKVTIYYIRA